MTLGAGKTVLLIDDDTSNLEALGEVLRKRRVRGVVCAPTGAEALACLPTHDSRAW
jgi:CheY-like chemotaxis protein